jgi:hypothetical protein
VKRAVRAATKAQASYQDRARELGCVVCRFRLANGYQDERNGQCGVTHIHHRNVGDYHGQKQLGQDHIVALGAWHHDGVLMEGETNDSMREIYGPSFKFAADFREWTYDVLPGYGRGTEAWQKYQDEELSK